MPVNILMPALSPTMEKGNLAKWLKKEGEKVKPGDVIAEIETDKATMEYESIDDGVLAKIVVPEGTQDVPVNQLIAVLAEEGEDAKAAAAGAGKGEAPKAKAPAAPPQSTNTGTPSPPPSGFPPASKGPASSPQAQPTPSPQGREGGGDGARSSDHGSRLFASPLAKRMAKDAGIDLARIQGS